MQVPNPQNPLFSKYVTTCNKLMLMTERREELLVQLAQMDLELEYLTEKRDILRAKVLSMAPDDDPQEEQKVGDVIQPKADKTAKPNTTKDEDYDQAALKCSTKICTDVLHENSKFMPRLVFTAFDFVTPAAFKACALSILKCSKCSKNQFGTNLAFMGTKASISGQLICLVCFKKLDCKPDIVVFHHSKAAAIKRWGTSTLVTFYGYQSQMDRDKFSIAPDGSLDTVHGYHA